MEKTKLYCFVDETGQDTAGRLFIVSVVIVEKEKDDLLDSCKLCEEESGKKGTKWRKAGYIERVNYLRRIFIDSRLKGNIRYSIFRETKNYDLSTIVGIAKAINWQGTMQAYTSAVYVDGLTKLKRREYSQELHKRGVHTHKVQGVMRDENNSLVRLADSVAGFVRDVLDGDRGEAKRLFEQVVKSGVLVEVYSSNELDSF